MRLLPRWQDPSPSILGKGFPESKGTEGDDGDEAKPEATGVVKVQTKRWKEHRLNPWRDGGYEGKGAFEFDLADLDGDGFLDVVAYHVTWSKPDSPEARSRRASDIFEHHRGANNPSVWDHSWIPTERLFGSVEIVKVTDIDGDGELDICAKVVRPVELGMYRPGAWMSRTSGVTHLAGRDTHDLNIRDRGPFFGAELADIDNDGDPDLVTTAARVGLRRDELTAGGVLWYENRKPREGE